MKKGKISGFICGFLVATLLFSTAAVGFASTGSKSITAVYNNIKLYVDQKLITPKDAAGNTVEPFIYNGTTYLPVRAVADALGQSVSWDNSTKSVYIGEQPEKTGVAEIPKNTVLMDKNKVKITYLGITKSDGLFGGVSINVKIENMSAQDCEVQIRDLSINNIMADGSFSCTVAAGKTAIDEIWVMEDDIDKTGYPASETSFKFYLFNWSNYDAFESSRIELFK